MSLALLIEWNSNLFILAGRFPHQVQRTEATQENKKTVILPAAAAAAAVAAAAAAAKSLQSDSVQPHGWQPTRLPCPWDSPGKNTGVGCHFLLQCMKVKSESEVAQSFPTLSNPMDCSLPDSSVHGIFQAIVLEWVAIVFSYLPNTFSGSPDLPSF